MFSLILVWINGLVNNREAGDLRPHRAQKLWRQCNLWKHNETKHNKTMYTIDELYRTSPEAPFASMV